MHSTTAVMAVLLMLVAGVVLAPSAAAGPPTDQQIIALSRAVGPHPVRAWSLRFRAVPGHGSSAESLAGRVR